MRKGGIAPGTRSHLRGVGSLYLFIKSIEFLPSTFDIRYSAVLRSLDHVFSVVRFSVIPSFDIRFLLSFLRIKNHLPLVIKNDTLNSNILAREPLRGLDDLLAHMRYDPGVIPADDVKSVPGRVGR